MLLDVIIAAAVLAYIADAAPGKPILDARKPFEERSFR